MEGKEGPSCEVRLPTPGAEREGPIHPELGAFGETASNTIKLSESSNDGKKEEIEEELDPRIQEELERLNQASEEINLLELQLDEARTAYRRILTESARRLNGLATQLGACIDKARPYYEARRLAKEVNEAEEERLRSEFEHQRVTRQCHEAEAKVQTLQKSLKRFIIKSRPYFELKSQLNTILEEHKSRVTSLENSVAQAKLRYSGTLRNLEQISEEIHARRTQSSLLSQRAPPLGAEAPPSVKDGETGPPADTVSLLSLQTIASDLQKSDSVEHLRDLTDVTSLDGRETGAVECGGSRERGGDRGTGGAFRHHRSVSL